MFATTPATVCMYFEKKLQQKKTSKRLRCNYRLLFQPVAGPRLSFWHLPEIHPTTQGSNEVRSSLFTNTEDDSVRDISPPRFFLAEFQRTLRGKLCVCVCVVFSFQRFWHVLIHMSIIFGTFWFNIKLILYTLSSRALCKVMVPVMSLRSTQRWRNHIQDSKAPNSSVRRMCQQ